MEREGRHKTAHIIRRFARIVLLLLGTLLFIFALLSGADRLGGGIKGIIANAPNALPWLFLLIAVFIAFKWELIGGLLILIMGIFTIFFFNAIMNLFVLLLISIPLIVCGKLLLIAWYLDRN